MYVAFGIWLVAVVTHATVTSTSFFRFWMINLEHKLEKFAAQKAACRIFLIGSSPIVFGLSATQLQAETGCAAANFGMLAGADVLDDYLQMVLRNVNSGDVVVLRDRDWTYPELKTTRCEDKPVWLCFVLSLDLSPSLRQDFVFLTDPIWSRSVNGDLISFPPYVGRLARISNAPLPDSDFRLKILAAQAANIESRGAHAILAAVPMLVSETARPGLELAFARFATEVKATTGPSTQWLGPLLETDVAMFTMDGQHSSEAGRRRWTKLVAASVVRSGFSTLAVRGVQAKGMPSASRY
jgi:hypothetical protein